MTEDPGTGAPTPGPGCFPSPPAPPPAPPGETVRPWHNGAVGVALLPSTLTLPAMLTSPNETSISGRLPAPCTVAPAGTVMLEKANTALPPTTTPPGTPP